MLSTEVSDSKLQVEFGDEWQEFLAPGNLQDVLQKARDSIERAAMFNTRGKGKGSGKGKACVDNFWGIGADNY